MLSMYQTQTENHSSTWSSILVNLQRLVYVHAARGAELIF